MNHSLRRTPRAALPPFATLTGLALAAALFVPALAHAGKGDRGPGKRAAKMCEAIDCSDQQEREIAQVFQQMRTDVQVDRKAIAELREQMASEWQKNQPSEATLEKLATKIAAHERNIADRRLEGMLELHGLLSPEQRRAVAKHVMRGKKPHAGKAKNAKPKNAKPKNGRAKSDKAENSQ